MMGKEDFSVSLERVNFHASINGDSAFAFRARSQETKNNLLRYLGEYRLAVKFDEFYYKEAKSSTGERFLAGEEEMPIIQRFRKAIYKKEKERVSSGRETAECNGFEKIEEAYLRGEDFLFLWISPPGKREEGYGDYSFTFIGEVKDKKIRVIPYRNKLSIIEHKRVAGIFSQRAKFFETDIDFLENPIFIQKENRLEKAEDILSKIGEKEKIDLSWRERLEQKIGGLMEMFVEAVKRNASDTDLERLKRAMENFTIDRKDEIITDRYSDISDDLDDSKIVDIYGRYVPPPVAGSCPSSGANTLSEFHFRLNKDRGYDFDHQGTCAVCSSGPKLLGPCEICKECVINIEEKEKWGVAA